MRRRSLALQLTAANLTNPSDYLNLKLVNTRVVEFERGRCTRTGSKQYDTTFFADMWVWLSFVQVTKKRELQALNAVSTKRRQLYHCRLHLPQSRPQAIPQA